MADATVGNDPDRGAVGHVLDLFVFAPLGLLAESHTIVPKLAESGRQHVDNRVQLARMVGQFAVQQGRRPIGHDRPRQFPEIERADVLAVNAQAIAGADVDDGRPVRRSPAATAASRGRLAIPSYDSLAASQVVPRLDGLSSIELEAVRRYEEAHRGRAPSSARSPCCSRGRDGVVIDVGARRAARPDERALVELDAEARASLVVQRGGPLRLLRELPPFDPDLLDDGDAIVVIGTIDGVVIGFAHAVGEKLADGEELVVLAGLYVDPGAREVGVGEAMMDLVMEWTEASGGDGHRRRRPAR
jgi:GNAT superfamily N-acetyltransferase